MRLLILSMAASALLFAALTPAANAHPAEPSPERFVRRLHDWNDDWGGHEALNDGHDLIVLALREAYEDGLGDVLVFRFILRGGYNGDATKSELKDVLTFKAGAAAISEEVTTTDNAAFTGTFDAVRGPEPFLQADGQPDGDRFVIDGVLKASAVGLSPGKKISEFGVPRYAGAAKADHMVGGCTSNGVAVNQKPPTETVDPAEYKKSGYTIFGPAGYVDLAPDTPKVGLVQGGDDATVAWIITNKLAVDQKVTLHAMLHGGITGTLHPGAEVELPKDGEVTVHLYLKPGESVSSGTATVALMTDQGGHVMKALDIAVEEPEPSVVEDDGSGALDGGATDGEPDVELDGDDAPADESDPESGLLPGLAIVALVVAAVVLVRRRK